MKPEFKPFIYSFRTGVGPIQMAVDMSHDVFLPDKNKLSYRSCEAGYAMGDRRLARRDHDSKDTRQTHRSVDSKFANTYRRENDYHREP